MTKFQKVINFISDNKAFTRKQYEKKFGKYPNTEGTYLTALLNADIVTKGVAGAFCRNVTKKDLRGITITKVLKSSIVDQDPAVVALRNKR